MHASILGCSYFQLHVEMVQMAMRRMGATQKFARVELFLRQDKL